LKKITKKDMKVDSVARKTLLFIFVVVVFTVSVLFLEGSKDEEDGHVEKEKLRDIQTALAKLQSELYNVKNEFLDKVNDRAEVRSTSVDGVHNYTRVVVPTIEKSSIENKVDIKLSPIRTSSRRAVIFTMDSIGSYEENSLAGGAAGKPMGIAS